MFSEAEQAALGYCEEYSGISALRAALAEHFSRKQVAEIAATVINMNLWTCLKQEQGAIPVAE